MRDVLERIPVPPESDTFFDRLWRKIETADRIAARRWRFVAIAVAAIAVTAATVGAVVAASRGSQAFDTTVACTVEDRGGLPAFDVDAFPNIKYPNGDPLPGDLIITTGQNTLLLGIDRRYKGYQLDSKSCHKAATIPLSPVGLPKKPHVYRAGQYGTFRLDCTVGKLVFRARLTTDGSGVVSAAKVAVRATKRAKPIAYVDWTPAKVVAYSVPPSGCAAY